MRKVIFPALIAVAIATSAFTVATTSTWKIKEDNYSVKITTNKFDGIFKGLKSEIHFDEANLGDSKITASIDANTINTGNGMRNKHAKQGLGAEQYPTIKFESSSFAKSTAGYEATGKLTIKDVTKEIKLPFTFTKNSEGGTFTGNFSVKPSDYKVEKKGTPETINIQLNIPVTK